MSVCSLPGARDKLIQSVNYSRFELKIPNVIIISLELFNSTRPPQTFLSQKTILRGILSTMFPGTSKKRRRKTALSVSIRTRPKQTFTVGDKGTR
jgi:hypothetical protein